ncbi:MAG: hypothetical protein JW809_00270 [Pirellulales bacterium]|nr:hypothetical protein [Pirellulales bacterium]
MDRIHSSRRPAKAPPAEPDFQVGSASFSRPAGASLHAIFTPLHYEPNYAYPLIVWLHGPSQDERQLARIMPLVSMRNYMAVAPQGIAVGPGSDHAGIRQYDWPQDWDHIEVAERRVGEAIDAVAQKYRFSPDRVFLAGFDRGGTMAFRVALANPRRFAGVLSFCGAFPSGQNPLGHLPEIRKMPIFLAVGRDSVPYPPDVACEDLRLLHTAGLSVTLRQYPCRHEICPQMLRDMDRWIIEQITSPT